jgi:hypothetical protein
MICALGPGIPARPPAQLLLNVVLLGGVNVNVPVCVPNGLVNTPVNVVAVNAFARIKREQSFFMLTSQ